MSVSTITVGSNTVSLVSAPAFMGFRSVQFNFDDTVGQVRYPFSGQTQTQEWPGADMWSGMMECPPLNQTELDGLKAFLMQCRGIKNGFMLGDPMKTAPSGCVNSSSVPVISGAVAAAAQSIATSGWKPSTYRLLLPGDYLQLGYRLHAVLDNVNSDGGGNATLNIWPATREALTAGSAVILKNPMGLFRRAQNRCSWSADVAQRGYSALSIPVMEYR